jgi:hypothetical protein
MVFKKEGQGDKGTVMSSSPFHLNTPASDDSFPSLLAVIDGMDLTLQAPQPWYDEMSPYTACHYSEPKPLCELALNQLATNDEGNYYVRLSSHQSTSDSIPTVSPTSARSEDKPSNADSAGVTIATARQAVSEAGTPIAHEGEQPHNPAVRPPLQHHSGSEGHPHHSASKPIMIYRDSSCVRIHLVVLCICDTCALYAPDWSAVMVWGSVPIYGSSHVLYVQYVWCRRGPLYYMHSVVVYVCVWP